MACQALVAPSATNGPWQIFAMPFESVWKGTLFGMMRARRELRHRQPII